MPRGSYRKERLGRRQRDGRRSLAAATTGSEARAHWLGLRGADDSGLGKKGQRGLNRGCFLGSALQTLGLLQVPSSLASRKGPGPAALSSASLPGRRKRPWERSCAEGVDSPGVDGLDPRLISALTASPRESDTSLNLFPLLSSEDHINLKQLIMKTAVSKGVIIRIRRVEWGVAAEEESSRGSPSLTPRCSCCTGPAPSSLGPGGGGWGATIPPHSPPTVPPIQVRKCKDSEAELRTKTRGRRETGDRMEESRKEDGKKRGSSS